MIYKSSSKSFASQTKFIILQLNGTRNTDINIKFDNPNSNL